MPVIGARVTTDVKVAFDSIANARDNTCSSLAAKLITDFVNEEKQLGKQADQQTLLSLSAPFIDSHEAKSEQVSVRLEPYYFAELNRMAAERFWRRGTYLGNLLRAHVDRRPVLCDLEVNAVRQVARQLADMGRNLNQIARKLNTSVEHAHLVASIDFELIKMLVELETNAVRALMKANVRGWGVSDVEA